jgi:hypothetical protein
MKGPGSFLQGYNAQVAVEPELQLIVGQAVTQQSNDKRQLLPMIHTVAEQSGQRAAAVLANSGYCSEDNLRETAELGVEAYIAVGKQKHNQPPPPAPRGRIPQSAVYGQIKPARGFRQFLVRGIEKVQGAWALVCTGHNLLKLHRACTAWQPRRQPPETQTILSIYNTTSPASASSFARQMLCGSGSLTQTNSWEQNQHRYTRSGIREVGFFLIKNPVRPLCRWVQLC